MKPDIALWQENDVPYLWKELVASWFQREFDWPTDRTTALHWRVLVTAGEDLVGHVGIVRREALVGEHPVILAGIGAVIVDPAWRGHGLGKGMMQLAADFMRNETDAAFGHLICEDHRLSFYQSLGWQKVSAPMFYTSWEGVREQVGRHHVMILPLRDTPWLDGDLDLCGMPW